jgi:hypothetical protein
MPVQLFASTDEIPTIHDWTFRTGAWKFGITEKDNLWGELLTLSPDVFQPTTIYLGMTSFETRLSAYESLAVTALVAVVLVAAISLVITKQSRQQGPSG